MIGIFTQLTHPFFSWAAPSVSSCHCLWKEEQVEGGGGGGGGRGMSNELLVFFRSLNSLPLTSCCATWKIYVFFSDKQTCKMKAKISIMRKCCVKPTGISLPCCAVLGMPVMETSLSGLKRSFYCNPIKFPPRSDGLDTIQVAPPVFTAETSQREIHYRLDVGDIFRISCEALGNPDPEIKWFKDGHEIRDPVRESDDFGKSSVEFHVMGSADGGTYTCQAQNGVGSRQLNFTLSVNVDSTSMQHAIVMEAKAINNTVSKGDSATLSCKVKAVMLPHIKWLKKLDLVGKEDRPPENVVDVYTLNMGNERFRVLDTAPDILIGDGIFLNNLVIPSVEIDDAGMYICFVTNSGFGALTYKSTHLNVIPRSSIYHQRNPSETGEGNSGRDIVISGAQSASESFVLILVICLVVITFVISVSVIAFVIRKSRRDRPKQSGGSHSSSNISSCQGRKTPDEEAIQQRPFLMSSSDLKYESAASPASLPPPPSIFSSVGPASSSMGYWSRTVYPTYGHIRSMPSQAAPHYENPNQTKYYGRDSPSIGNQYEVPYSHLKQSSSGKSSSNSNQSYGLSNNNAMFASQPQFQYPLMGGTGPLSHVHGLNHHAHPQPHPSHNHHGANGSLGGGVLSTGHLDPSGMGKKDSPPFRSYPYFQYLGDYET
ncbi:uncharacterized protein LOC131880721 isoform X1 [Tigriopus californicus]|uniref:uncharacterized protein LOC131880721 isoform X1 n=1 Tax=Tigriopus californicus TaxID=6832 RepID=UPI0027DA840E|nr:uncharacterized protein LOC131880721 isoform X1 [Tigriopus californicus]